MWGMEGVLGSYSPWLHSNHWLCRGLGLNSSQPTPHCCLSPDKSNHSHGLPVCPEHLIQKALTRARFEGSIYEQRYFLLQLFCFPTEAAKSPPSVQPLALYVEIKDESICRYEGREVFLTVPLSMKGGSGGFSPSEVRNVFHLVVI